MHDQFTSRRFLLLSWFVMLASPFAWVHAHEIKHKPAAPEFTHSEASEWINSAPLTLNGLKGSHVLIEFWTYACHNCKASVEFMKSLAKRYPKLKVVSVHTPEFDYERDPKKVRKSVKDWGIDYPVLLDNDYSYWNALGNRYWPAIYLVDTQGRLTDVYIGEVVKDGKKATKIHKKLQSLFTP